MNKKMIAISLIAVTLFAESTALAKTESITRNTETENFVIAGKSSTGLSGKRVKVIVLKPGKTLNDLSGESASEALYYADEVYTKDGGAYTITVPMSTDADGGEYTFYVQDGDGEKSEKLNGYYENYKGKKKCIKDINDASSDTEKQTALTNAVKALGVDEALVSAVSGEAAELLYKHKTKKTLDEEDFKSAKELINKLAVVAAFNSGKSELLENNGEYLFSSVLDLSQIDKNGSTLYNFYEDEMSAEGKKSALKKLYNQGFESAEELLNKFAEAVLLDGLKYPKNDGTGHIEKILTKTNADKLKISIDSYLNITDSKHKKNVEQALKTKTFSSASDFAGKLSGIVADCKPSQGSGGSSGGGNASNGASLPVITPIENNQVLQNSGFSDMDGYSWAEEAVNYLFVNGIVSGMGNNMFSPSAEVKREQIAVMIINSLGVEFKDAKSDFSDVENGSYYEKHIAVGTELGIINGVGGNLFGVGESITRQDICTMIYRAYFAGETMQDKTEFTDSDAIDEYAAEAVGSLAEKGVVNGFSDGSFRPKELCTRAQAAKMLYAAIMYAEN